MTVRIEALRVYNIIIIGIIYSIFGLWISFSVNKFSPALNTSASKEELWVQILTEISATLVLTYFLHIIVARIPLPLLGPKAVREDAFKRVRGGIITSFSMFALQVKLRYKIQYVFFGHMERSDFVDY